MQRIIVRGLGWFFVFSLLVCNNARAQYLTDSAQIYLLTASWGDDPASAFGHSAIRVSDPAKGYNLVYGYGTYDFDTPNFYLKFTTGKLMYSLSRVDYERFYNSYQRYGQALYEQKFNFTNKEKWTLVTNLENNYLPENRYYRYDFFFDNCATRIRDIIAKSVDGKLLYDSTYVKKPLTFRHLIRPNYATVPWLNFGIDLVFGTVTDRVATTEGYMFLPEHIMNIYAKTTLVRNGSSAPLTQPINELFPGTIVFNEPSFATSPTAIFTLLFMAIMLITVYGMRKNCHLRWLDFTLFFIFGVLGSLFLFLMAASLHEELWYNFNIAWANPLALLIAGVALTKYKPVWYKYTLWVYVIILTLFIPLSFLLQDVPAGAYPLMGILWVRSLCLLVRSFYPEKNFMKMGQTQNS